MTYQLMIRDNGTGLQATMSYVIKDKTTGKVVWTGVSFHRRDTKSVRVQRLDAAERQLAKFTH